MCYVEYTGQNDTMGSILGKAMDENFKKNQEFMLASQRAQVRLLQHIVCLFKLISLM